MSTTVEQIDRWGSFPSEQQGMKFKEGKIYYLSDRRKKQHIQSLTCSYINRYLFKRLPWPSDGRCMNVNYKYAENSTYQAVNTLANGSITSLKK